MSDFVSIGWIMSFGREMYEATQGTSACDGCDLYSTGFEKCDDICCENNINGSNIVFKRRKDLEGEQ